MCHVNTSNSSASLRTGKGLCNKEIHLVICKFPLFLLNLVVVYPVVVMFEEIFKFGLTKDFLTSFCCQWRFWWKLLFCKIPIGTGGVLPDVDSFDMCV